MTRVVVVANDLVQRRMAGPGIRSLELARRIAAAGHATTLAVPRPSDVEAGALRIVPYDDRPLDAVVEGHDVAVIQGYALHHHPALGRQDLRLVVDLYDPIHLEALFGAEGTAAADPDRLRHHRHVVGVVNEQLRRGDFFLCASERQRDLWLGALASLGRVNPLTHAGDPDLRRLVDVVPFGIPEAPPERRGPGPRELLPGVGAGDLVVLWGGGLYDWLDPLVLVEAVARAAASVPHLRLVMHAARHPNPAVGPMRIAEEVRARAGALELTGTHVFFNETWVEYDHRADWLLDADVGVSTHPAHVETRFAFRTRVLDYLWAGLPVLCTEGDSLGDLVEQRALGLTVPPGSPEALAAALVALADPARRQEMAGRVRAVAAGMTWDAAALPLLRYCADPRPGADLGGRRPRPPLDGRPPAALRAAVAARDRLVRVAGGLARRGGG